jgi:hypothetical protein
MMTLLLELRCEGCGYGIVPTDKVVAESFPVYEDDFDLNAEPTGEVTYHMHKHCHEEHEYWFQWGFDSAKREAEEAMCRE